MNPTDAHDIVNKEINLILKALEDLSEDYGYVYNSEEDNKEIDIKISHHRGLLKGIISQEATEIEDKELFVELCDYNCYSHTYLNPNNRLQALKISMDDLKEVVK